MKETKEYIHLNSENRDSNAYPSGNSYTMYLPKPLKNIVSAEIMVARVPNTIYNITTSGQILVTQDSTVSLPAGFYADPVVLATEISNRLNSSETFQWIPAEGKFIYLHKTSVTSFVTVTSDDAATLLGFTTGTVNYTIPVSLSDTSITGYTKCVKSPTTGDMTKNDFIFLEIPELGHTRFQDASSGPYNAMNASGLFTGITLDVPPNTVKIFKHNDYPISVTYDVPIASISKLTVKWYDKNRKLVNFQGLEDNAVILRFTTNIDAEPLDIPEISDFDKERDEFKRKLIESVKPPEIRQEKKLWGKWVFVLGLIALFAIWSLKKTSGVNSLRRI